MKLKKIFAGMAASAIAMTTFAMGSAPAASADATVSGNAGVTFQTANIYNYRDITNTAGDHGVFPQKEVGVQGGGYGFDTTLDCGDTAISGSGTYTVSIATSGTIDTEPDLTKPANQKSWYIDEAQTLTRKDSPWSMMHNYEPATNDGSEEITAENLTWEKADVEAESFNMLCVSTDIPAFYDKENHKCYLDEEMTKEVTVTDVSVDIPGAGNFTGDAGVWKDDVDTICISVINAYADDGSTIDPAAFPTEDGTISITFTINFAEGSNDSTESNESGTESGDSNASGSDSNASSSSSSSSSKGGNGNGGSNGGSKGGTTKTETAESLAESASDATENAKSGAPAGIALALAAVAGAVVVVSRKKN